MGSKMIGYDGSGLPPRMPTALPITGWLRAYYVLLLGKRTRKRGRNLQPRLLRATTTTATTSLRSVSHLFVVGRSRPDFPLHSHAPRAAATSPRRRPCLRPCRLILSLAQLLSGPWRSMAVTGPCVGSVILTHGQPPSCLRHTSLGIPPTVD